MNLIVPEKNKQIIAENLGFRSFSEAVAAVEAMPLNEFGYAEIRKNDVHITKSNNPRVYARISCGGGKSGMAQDWAVSAAHLTVRGQAIQSGRGW